MFAGSGIVSKHLCKLGYTVHSNDIMYYSYVNLQASISNSEYPKFSNVEDIPCSSYILDPNNTFKYSDIINYLNNNMEQTKGFIYNNYSPASKDKRRYFTESNAGKIDYIRTLLEQWLEEGKINYNEYYCILSGIIEGVDKIANTTGVYSAYLKKFKDSSKKPFRVQQIQICPYNAIVTNLDANTLAQNIEEDKYDIVYMDPPYNERQYGRDYHILETVARYDNPKIHGITGVREYTRSDFSSKLKAKDCMDKLIRDLKVKYILISYNNEGNINIDDFKSILSKYGHYDLLEKKYKRYKADLGRSDISRDNDIIEIEEKEMKYDRDYSSNEVSEYIWILEKK